MSSPNLRDEFASWLEHVSSNTGVSREFFDFVRSIGEAKSKDEEDRFIAREINALKTKMSDPEKNTKRMREYLMRMIYCEMLGHAVPFGYIHAVNMSQEHGAIDKRIGYLAVTLTLNEEHELMILLINTLQKDLKSNNVLDVCAALTTLTKLMNAEIIPVISQTVFGLVSHAKYGEIVRKKAALVMHKFYLKSPSMFPVLLDKFKRLFCDKDPSVMSATLGFFYDAAQNHAEELKQFTSSLVAILKQIIELKLPKEYDYHRVPAPWVQIKLLGILGLLGADDQTASEEMYEVLFDVLRKSEEGTSSHYYAIVYEAVRTISSIHPNLPLLEAAARCVARFITSENHNLKYMGITALATLVQVNPKFATVHQGIVIDSLEDPDETLKRKTLDLLFKMTNPANVTFVVSRLIKYLRSTIDIYLRTELVSRITQLAERYAPTNAWFIETMTTVFELGGDLVRPEVHHNLMRLIAEGSGVDDEADNQLRQYAVDTFLKLVARPSLNDTVIQLVAWVVGEYAYLSKSYTLEDIITKIASLSSRHYESPESRGWIVNALAKLVSQLGSCPSYVRDVFQKYQKSRLLSLTQRCTEYLSLAKDMDFMQQVLPMDASCEDIEIDEDFSLVDDFVSASLRRGASPYIPKEERGDALSNLTATTEQKGLGISTLRFEAYEKPTEYSKPNPSAIHISSSGTTLFPTGASNGQSNTPLGTSPSHDGFGDEPPSSQSASSGLAGHGAARKWGKAGYIGDQQNAQKQESAPQPSEPQSSYSSASVAPNTTTSASSPGHSTTAPVSQVLSPRAQPAPMTEKEKLASMLFSGIDGNQKPERTGRKPRHSTLAAKTSSNASSNVGTPTHTAVNKTSNILDDFDLLDMAVSSSPTQTAQQSKPFVHQPYQSQPTSSGSADLLSIDLLSFDSTPTPKPASAYPALSAPMQPTHGLFQNVLQPTLVPSPRGQPPPTNLLGDLSTQFTVPKSTLEKLAPQIRDEIVSVKPTPEPVTLSFDPVVHVQVFKVLRPDHVMLCFVYQVQGANRIGTLSSRLEATPSLTVAEKYSMPSLPPGYPSWINITSEQLICDVIRLRFKEALKSVVSGKISYSFDNPQNLTTVGFELPLLVSDFIRPLQMTTDGFGQKWGQHEFEKRVRINGVSVATPQEYLSTLEKHLNIFPVHIIGWEAISSGNVTTRNLVCLIHGKLTGNALDITVRTKEKNLSELVAERCVSVFQQK